MIEKQHMDVKEYLHLLGEQIQNPNARRSVLTEIENHIEEQAEEYEAHGMEAAQARQEAVKEMGDPIRVGLDLNRLHRPKFPTGMFLLALGLMVFGIIMQGILFQYADAPAIQQGYLGRTICYNFFGIGIILLFLFGNYMYLTRWAYVLYLLFLAAEVLRNPLLTMAGGNGWWISVPVLQKYAIGYYMWMFFPIVYAVLLYRLRDKGGKGILCLHLLTAVAFGYELAFSGCITGVAESLCLSTILLFLAVYRGIIKGPKRKRYLLASVYPILVAAGIAGLFLRQRPSYLLQRIFGTFFLKDELNYVSSSIRQTDFLQMSLFGGGTVSGTLPKGDLYSTYLAHSVFLWFGVATGIIVIAALLVFAGLALYKSLRQSNRAAFLIGSVCSMGLLLRIVVYILMNFGFGIYYTVSVPFLTYGFVNCVVNAVYVGILLCIFRNQDVLDERCMPESRHAVRKHSVDVKRLMEKMLD